MIKAYFSQKYFGGKSLTENGVVREIIYWQKVKNKKINKEEI